MESHSRSLLGLLAAGAAGVAIGMLLAPEKGSDTRQSLKDTLDNLGNKLSDLMKAGKETVEEEIDEKKQQFSNAKNEAKEFKNDVKQSAKNHIDNVKESYT